MRLRQLIGQPMASPELARERREFADLLVRHLITEDGMIYPQLITGDSQQVAAIARAFAEELGGLAQRWSDYCRQWDDASARADWAGFVATTTELLDILATRIMREERILYPLAERAATSSAA